MLSNKFAAGNIVLIDAKGKPHYETTTSVYLLVVTYIFSPLLASILFFPQMCLFPESRNYALKRYFSMRCVTFIAVIWGFPAHRLVKHTCTTLGWLLPSKSAAVTHICATGRAHGWRASKENNLEPNAFPKGDSFSSQYQRKYTAVYSISFYANIWTSPRNAQMHSNILGFFTFSSF